MLTYTFQHLEGIGPKTERGLWRSGVTSWDELIKRRDMQLSMFSTHLGKHDQNSIYESKLALENGDANFFAKQLPRQEHYRIALAFPYRTLFLDIETTGLSTYYDSITVVGWSMGSKYGFYVKGGDDEELKKALEESKAIITFNGTLFDLPFLRQEFPGIQIPTAHVDLRFFARRVGLSGGQKTIERVVGINRPSGLRDVDGATAVLLWHKYRQGILRP